MAGAPSTDSRRPVLAAMDRSGREAGSGRASLRRGPLDGYTGVTVGWVEGVEVNILGAVAGVDLRRPAPKLPGLPQPVQDLWTGVAAVQFPANDQRRRGDTTAA